MENEEVIHIEGEKIQELERRLKQLDEKISMTYQEIYNSPRIVTMRAKIEDLERQIETITNKAEESEIKPLQKEYRELRDSMIDLKNNAIKQARKKFIEVLKSYMDKGYIIQSVEIEDDYRLHSEYNIGDSMDTNFMRTVRYISGFKVTRNNIKYISCEFKHNHDQVEETNLSESYITKNGTRFIEVIIVSHLKGRKECMSSHSMVKVRNEDGSEYYTSPKSATMSCPVCGASYGEIEAGNGETLMGDYTKPHCPHADLIDDDKEPEIVRIKLKDETIVIQKT